MQDLTSQDFGHSQEGTFFSEALIPSGYFERANQFEIDQRVNKIDLGAGVVRDDHGSIVVFDSVLKAFERCKKNLLGNSYSTTFGDRRFCSRIQELLLSEASQDLESRAFTLQTVGASQALRIAADCLVRLELADQIYISEESWADHRRIFNRAGMQVQSYPYLNKTRDGIDFDLLIDAIQSAESCSAILLQVNCHNPTGFDFSLEQWEKVFDLCKQKNLLPILDSAYIGYSDQIYNDLAAVRKAVEMNLDFFVANSCCKMFGLYDARVGSLTAVCSSPKIANLLASQLRIEVQANHSSPPRFMAQIIAEILSSKDLFELHNLELEKVRNLLEQRRVMLASSLSDLGLNRLAQSIGKQKGIFAWTGLSKENCRKLREEFAIYLPSNGRICIGALRKSEVERLAKIIAGLD